MKKLVSIILFFIIGYAYPQNIEFTRADSLRGSLTPLRTSFDVYYYDLLVEVIPEDQAIKGSNKIFFSVIHPTRRIQLDLFRNMAIDSILFNGENLPYEREENAFFINFPTELHGRQMIEVFYHGEPVIAARPPWDGGFVWASHSDSIDWIAVAVQGTGASLWWPNKDHLSDEPDSMSISCTVPEGLVAVANGKLRDTSVNQGKSTYQWFVNNPINNYNVSLNITNYSHFTDQYITGEGDTLLLDYYVLPHNINKANKHFQQVPGMLKVFEKLFGPYPFIDDGFKLVETPYWGMEHQSAIAYGNEYKNNEFGFDFIIIHESGHEYWGNSITTHDLGEMWIHEAFTTYMEALYVEEMSGYDSAILYLKKQQKLIKNNMAIQQPTGVNFKHWDDADMYYKGSWMLHTVRNVINNDSLWYKILYDLHQEFRLSIVTSEDIISFINNRTKQNLRPVFDQFLNYTDIPVLHYKITSTKNGVRLSYKWEAAAPGFQMPLLITVNGQPYQIQPTSKWQKELLRQVKIEDIVLPLDKYYFIPKTHTN